MSEAVNFRFLVIDDHPMFREALQSAIRAAYPKSEIVDAASLAEANKALAENANFDLALLDLAIPDTEGYFGLLELRNQHPRMPIVVVSGHEEAHIIRDVMAQGASGFVPKSTPRGTLADAIARVIQGDIYLPEDYSPPVDVEQPEQDRLAILGKLASLTPQQLRVTRMVQSGLLNKQIAYELGVGETTVKAHVSEVLRKLNVHSRTQVVIELSKLDDKDLNRFQTEE
ncbi:response regulator transcription factor [Notoacmeibacter sp. MSK16QG-6]|uniref:response regulator n=1 Tax=Notoacmeibacter sp. MSK16QG-6 TaxID=2957982 RepID=UPI0020A0CE5F|nr:response regulator transcription factor [Notoacmeibacter sp. MSK16QG-6]MCP1200825.1 response regulator transcription factor [Notoacmeibacter sp. MSK16QG-6]